MLVLTLQFLQGNKLVLNTKMWLVYDAKCGKFQMTISIKLTNVAFLIEKVQEYTDREIASLDLCIYLQK